MTDPPANPPANHGFNIADRASPATELQQATKARQINGNVVRRTTGIRWTDFEPSMGAYVSTGAIKTTHDLIMSARASSGNQALKALVIWTGPVPAWIASNYPDQVDVPGPGGFYAVKKSPSGSTFALDRLGMAFAKALSWLSGAIPLPPNNTTDDVCDFIELYNEPNGQGGSPNPMDHFGPIDPYIYGDMAAYVGFWVWQTLNSGSSPPKPGAHPIMGALLTGDSPMPPFDYQTYLQDAQCQMLNTIYSIDPTDVDAIQVGVRASFHPYPTHVGSDDVGPAETTVNNKLTNVLSITASQQPGVSGRKVWITETAYPSSLPNPFGNQVNQRDFLQNVSNNAGNFSRVEGFVYFPLATADENLAGSSFTGTAVTNETLTNKLAATWTTNNWT